MQKQYMIAGCDILGFSHLVQMSPLQNVVNDSFGWLRKSLHHSLHKRDFPNEIPKKSDFLGNKHVGIAWFSDTFLLYSRRDDKEAIHQLIQTVGWLLFETMSIGRGAVIRGGEWVGRNRRNYRMKATGLLARMFVRSSSTRKPFTRRFVEIALTTSKSKDLTLIAHPVHYAPRKLAPFESGEHVEQLLLLDCPPWPPPHLCHGASILLGVPENWKSVRDCGCNLGTCTLCRIQKQSRLRGSAGNLNDNSRTAFLSASLDVAIS
jgi:hypothetical protein